MLLAGLCPLSNLLSTHLCLSAGNAVSPNPHRAEFFPDYPLSMGPIPISLSAHPAELSLQKLPQRQVSFSQTCGERHTT